mgnify:CR=1 FL=1
MPITLIVIALSSISITFVLSSKANKQNYVTNRIADEPNTVVTASVEEVQETDISIASSSQKMLSENDNSNVVDMINKTQKSFVNNNLYHPADTNYDYKISQEEFDISYKKGGMTEDQISQMIEFFSISNGYKIQRELDGVNFPTNVNFRNCDYSGFFDEKGGIFRCQNGGGIEVKIDNSKAMGNFKIGLEITVPEEKEINERQDSSIPYLGAIKIDLKEIGQSPQDYSGPAPVFTVNVPLKSKLPPGTRLEARLKGDYIGLGIQEWRLQGEGLAAVVSDDGLTASFESKELPGLFIVSRFVLPIINYDEILNQN